jgi:hypothetical protein
MNTLNSLSKRLNFLIESAGIKKTHLASKIGISPQAINHLCNKDASRSRHTKDLAKILNANPQWLASGEGDPFITNPVQILNESSHLKEVNIYNTSRLKKAYTPKELAELSPSTKILVDLETKHQPIGFSIQTNDLNPRFEKHDIVILEQKNEILNGDLGMIYSYSFKHYIFCYLHRHIASNTLFGFVPTSKIGVFVINKNDILYGVHKLSIRSS